MYSPPHFRLDDSKAALEAIARWPLAMLVSDGPTVTHLPMLREGDTLIGHVAEPNSHWTKAADGGAAIAVFSGPSTYISPGFYETKAEHGRVVPTWNYVAIHVRGTIIWLHEAEQKRAIVRALTDHFESAEARPWSIDDAPAEFITAMLGGIVGVRLTIESVKAQFKLSQNRREDDRSGVELGLTARGDAASLAIVDLMRRYGPREG